MKGLTDRPVLISGIGFFLCLASFLIAAILGKSSAATALFVTGFAIGSIGVLIGFLSSKKSE